MARLLLFDIAMFLLPFLLYGVYVYATRGNGEEGTLWQEMPWGWLALAGVVTLAAGLAVLVSFTGAPPGGTYHPPQMENGVIKPGRIE